MCTHYLFHVKNKSFHALCSKAHYAPVTDRSSLMTSLDPDTLDWMWYVPTHRTEYHLQITSKRISRSAKQHLITSGNICCEKCSSESMKYFMQVHVSHVRKNLKLLNPLMQAHIHHKSAMMAVPWLKIICVIAIYCSSALQQCTTTKHCYSTLISQLQWTGIKLAIKSIKRSIAKVNQEYSWRG